MFTSINIPSNPSDTENNGPADPSTSNIPDWLIELEPINLNAVESVSDAAIDLDIIAAEDAVNGKGFDVMPVNCDPSPKYVPKEAVDIALPDTLPDEVIWFNTALLPDTMTFFQFGILLFIVVGYSI